MSAPKFAIGDRVGARGHGTGEIVGFDLVPVDGPAEPEYVVLIDQEPGEPERPPVRVAESDLRHTTHPKDCQHPRCQLPF